MAYESPIEKIFGEIHNEVMRKDEENLMTVVSQTVGYTVDRTELLKALQYDRQQYEKGYADAERICKNKWIPVSKRLPKDCTAVLIWCPERKNIYCAYLEEKQWWIFGAHFQRVTLDVTAWMPLPEPYTAESEE